MRVPFDDVLPHNPTDKEQNLVALHEAVQSLAAFDARNAQVVELRFFGGLGVEETAAVLRVSPQTANRDWLAREMIHH